MMKSNEIRAIYHYKYKRDLKALKTARNMNEEFGTNQTNEPTFQQWFKRFRNVKDSLENEVRGNRPPVFDNDKLKVLVDADQSIRSRVLAKNFVWHI